MHYDKQNRKLEKLQSHARDLEERIKKAEQDRHKMQSVLQESMHEVRRLNDSIGTFCIDLSQAVTDRDFHNVAEAADSVAYASGLISSRLAFSDFELNPHAFGRQVLVRTGIYRKFDKAKKLLSKAARNKHCRVLFEGTSFDEIDAVPAFELVPFVLLDNAIKYSPDGQDVDVKFESRPSTSCHMKVTVSSIGPQALASEIGELVKRGRRGENAIHTKIQGEGLGLFLAQTLAKSANAKLSITSSSNVAFNLNGVPYSNFRVELDFYKRY